MPINGYFFLIQSNCTSMELFMAESMGLMMIALIYAQNSDAQECDEVELSAPLHVLSA